MTTETQQQLTVVHSSFGRVRVHLPDPDGRAVAWIRRLPGVTYAQGNQWTENILVLFEPSMAGEEDVLAALVFVAENPQAAAPEPMQMLDNESNSALTITASEPTPYVTGLQRTIYQALGWVSVGLAVVGFIVPGIPGAPFVVLAGYFFIRSSPKNHSWLRSSRWFGPILRDWEDHGGVRRSLKITVLVLITVAIVVILLSGLPPALIAFILLCEIIGMIIVSRLKVVEPTPVTYSPAPSA